MRPENRLVLEIGKCIVHVVAVVDE